MTETSWEKWDRESNERHAAQVKAGLHDGRCEWGPRIVKTHAGERITNMHLCHCAKRSRIASGFNKPPGVLWYRNPDCPRCYAEVEHDGDSFVCLECNVSWDPSDPDDEGSFTDDYGDLGRRAPNQQVVGGDRS